VRLPDGTSRRVQKVTGAEFAPGTTVVYHTGGGGGWGNPLHRDPAAVLNDVIQGYVSPAAARDDYGVLLTADGRAVDAAATTRLRERLREGGGEWDPSGEAQEWQA
jgi:N-methylhydantoinase B